MPYNQNIPQATDQLKNSQSQILANFQAIKTLIDVNHGTFSAADQGKHKWVTLPQQGAAPATAASEMALYTKSSGGVPTPFIRQQSNGTEYSLIATNAGTYTLGYTLLPGNIKMLWGRSITPAGGLITVSTAAGVVAGWPGFTAIPSVQVTVNYSGGLPAGIGAFLYSANIANLSIQSINTSNGTARPNVAANWFAIGV